MIIKEVHIDLLRFYILFILFALFVLFIWNVILTVKLSKLNKTKSVWCRKCGCAQIATVKEESNNATKIVNVCQHCGNYWELHIN